MGKLSRVNGQIGGLILPGFELLPVGLVPTGKATFEQWEAAGKALGQVEGAVHWWLGDWLNHGERSYGEKFSQALDPEGFAYQTLRNDKWVAERVELSRRRDNLPWSHHAEVAALEPVEQDTLLDKAEVNNLSRSQLRAEVNSLKAAKRDAERLEALKSNAGDFEPDIRCQDCCVGLASLTPDSVDLIFADPPYNIGIDYGDGEDADRVPGNEYMWWVAGWLMLCRDALKPDGTLWVLIGDEYAAEYAVQLKATGFTVRAWIKWYETFGVCNSAGTNFSRCSRHLFYCVKDPDNYTWNLAAVTRLSDRQTEYNDARANPEGKVWDDVWEISRLQGTSTERLPEFPTQLPLALLRPIVGCSSNPGDLVVDPFCSSATTGAAALEAGRRFIGFEKQARFVELATLRLKGVRP